MYYVTNTLTVGSLFSGIGGFDYAAEIMGWRTIWYSEIEPYCCQIMQEHFPKAANVGDITKVDWTGIERPDILCGGFPCQPSSVSGKRLGVDDSRWLWPEFARAIRALRPRWVVAENVPGLFTASKEKAFEEVLKDLAQIGYDAEWGCLSAAAVGAPHRRNRVWIVAYLQGTERGLSVREDARDQAPELERCCEELGNPRSGRPLRFPTNEDGRNAEGPVEARCASVGDTISKGLEKRGSFAGNFGQEFTPIERECSVLGQDTTPWADGVRATGADGTARLIPRGAAKERSELQIFALVDGISDELVGQRTHSLWPITEAEKGKTDRLAAVGNAIVPLCAIQGPFRMIAEREAACA